MLGIIRGDLGGAGLTTGAFNLNNGISNGINGAGTTNLASSSPARQWRGSIVGEIDDNGVYTVHENAEQEEHVQRESSDSSNGIDGGQVSWREDAVWISNGGVVGSGFDINVDADADVVDVDVDWDFAIKMEA